MNLSMPSAGESRLLVERARELDRLGPTRDRMDIDFNDAGIGRHFDNVQPRIRRRLVAFHVDRHVELGGGRFDGGEELEIVFQPFERWHEYAKPPIARLDRHGSAHRDIRRLANRHDRGCQSGERARMRRLRRSGNSRGRRTDRPAPNGDNRQD